MAWMLLILAGLFEMAWAIGLKYTEGFTRLWPTAGTLASMLINFQFAGERLDAYPKLRAYLQKLLRRPCFQQTFAHELPAAEAVEGLDVTVLRAALS